MTRKRQALLAAGLAILALSVSACTAEMRQELHDIGELQAALRTHFGHSEVTVSLLNGVALQVGFVNSAFNSLTDSERRLKAKEIAQFAREHYAHKDALSVIDVLFIVHKNYLGVFSYTNALDNYRFEKADLETGEVSKRTE